MLLIQLDNALKEFSYFPARMLEDASYSKNLDQLLGEALTRLYTSLIWFVKKYEKSPLNRQALLAEIQAIMLAIQERAWEIVTIINENKEFVNPNTENLDDEIRKLSIRLLQLQTNTRLVGPHSIEPIYFLSTCQFTPKNAPQGRSSLEITPDQSQQSLGTHADVGHIVNLYVDTIPNSRDPNTQMGVKYLEKLFGRTLRVSDPFLHTLLDDTLALWKDPKAQVSNATDSFLFSTFTMLLEYYINGGQITFGFHQYDRPPKTVKNNLFDACIILMQYGPLLRHRLSALIF